MADHAVSVFHDVAAVLTNSEFVRSAGTADVVMTPLGVAGLITPWNGNAGTICGKLATALAAGLHGGDQAERDERDPDSGGD